MVKSALIDEARARGFDVAGITKPDAVPEAKARLERFLAEGLHGDMVWMETSAERRGSPLALWPEVRSVIMLGMNYGPSDDPLGDPGAKRPRRHLDLCQRRRLPRTDQGAAEKLGGWLVAKAGGDVKVFVDTAAVMEKPLAAQAGLGWQGKHTNLVSRQFGSWLFLGSIFTTLDLPADQAEPDNCGSCRACLDICPTAAFPAPYRLDARRCISYLTIEHKGPIPRELRAGDRQPHLRLRRLPCRLPLEQICGAGREAKLAARETLRAPRLAELARLDDAQFRALFAKSSIKRTGRDRFVRNVLIAIGNSGDASLAREAERLLDDASPLVRGAAVWALSRLMPRENLAPLQKSRRRSAVNEEWAAALS